jgi:hypothetical protein
MYSHFSLARARDIDAIADIESQRIEQVSGNLVLLFEKVATVSGLE